MRFLRRKKRPVHAITHEHLHIGVTLRIESKNGVIEISAIPVYCEQTGDVASFLIEDPRLDGRILVMGKPYAQPQEVVWMSEFSHPDAEE